MENMLHGFKMTDGLMAHYARLLCDTVIPFQEDVINDRNDKVEPSHAVRNFKYAAKLRKTGIKDGDFYGFVFQDSDVAKWIEAAAYSLIIKPDESLEKRIDELVDIIAEAQEDDGYLDTFFTLGKIENRLTNLCEAHELYCAGHMMEAGVGLYEATGKDKLLKIVMKNADYLYNHFITEGHEGYSGHPEVELALMRLYRCTGEERYKELAVHFINVRGGDNFFEREMAKAPQKIWGGDGKDTEYNQSHLPIRQQKDAVGHSVRAGYLYTAVADVAEATGDKELIDVCHSLFDSITKKRMYITGGVGSTVYGEAYTKDYELPNDTNYAETCASISVMMFAKNMLRMEKNGKYADVIERCLYNTVFAGIELNGKKFFYVNPLELIPGVSGVIPTHRHVVPQRPGWYGCACCPPNAARTVTSVAKYAWDYEDGTLYNHMFLSGNLDIDDVKMTVETKYPFGDTVKYTVTEGKTRLAVHIPAFSKKKFNVKLNGKNAEYENVTGYAYVNVEKGDIVEVEIDMTPKYVRANTNVARDSGCAAVIVGPVVYAAEGKDNEGDVFNFTFDTKNSLEKELITADKMEFTEVTEDFGEFYTVKAVGEEIKMADPDELYFEEDEFETEKREITLIPYFMWGNRGLNQMRIWIPAK